MAEHDWLDETEWRLVRKRSFWRLRAYRFYKHARRRLEPAEDWMEICLARLRAKWNPLRHFKFFNK